MEKISDSMKKILLAGIGAAATTAEKSKEILDDLVKKGELTWKQKLQKKKQKRQKRKQQKSRRYRDSKKKLLIFIDWNQVLSLLCVT